MNKLAIAVIACAAPSCLQLRRSRLCLSLRSGLRLRLWRPILRYGFRHFIRIGWGGWEAGEAGGLGRLGLAALVS
jgi:hypothetical protein